tara:strand:+ start:2946 stop:3863 length:918 start_codon:yes stop_codon:yes gene_type:complete
MYYPKSQIKTDLYTNGNEYSIKGSQTSYVGYYWKTSQNKFYSGKTPNSGDNLQLIPLYDMVNADENDFSIPLEGFSNKIESIITIDENGMGDTDPTYNFKGELRNEFISMQYENVKSFNTKNGRSTPEYYRTLPTQPSEKYTRYFAKQNNAPIFIETSKETFSKFSSKDPNVALDLYSCLSLSWSRQENAISINKTTVSKIEKQNNWYGFYNYFKGKFDDSEPTFDSLYTNGGEFLLPNRTNYIGYYHFMPNGTAMTGKNHSDGDEITLISINNQPSSTQPTTSSPSTQIPSLNISRGSSGGGGY